MGAQEEYRDVDLGSENLLNNGVGEISQPEKQWPLFRR